MAHTQQPHEAERKLRKTLREIITPEEYVSVIKGLIEIATSGKKDTDRIAATRIIIDRLEGKVPDVLLHRIENNLTIADILGEDEQ